ncbi:MAG: hypothetical protein NZM11_10935 [Anaerolineales bacterium]|nr:hypothetical protein [Anaerolineales bacterium]
MRTFASVAELAREMEFPLYALGEMSNGLRLGSAFLITHDTGEVYGASLGFETYNPESACWECTVSLQAYPDFPRPFPLWSRQPEKPADPAVVLEKVGFLPTPGIRVMTRAGYVCHWIEEHILYTLVVEPSPTIQEAKMVPDLLERFPS